MSLKPLSGLAALVLWPTCVSALELSMPAPVAAVESRSENPGSYALPTGPFAAGQIPLRQVEGAVDQQAYRLDAKGMTLVQLMTPLRDQLKAQGFAVILDCEARDCGGFDFRYGIEVMAEPAMHVDLGEFRFLSAERPGEVVSLLVSRSAASGFVQVTRVGATAMEPVTGPETVTVTPPVAPVAPIAPPEETTDAPVAEDLTAQLDAGLAAVLDDLVFESGSSALEDRDYASLARLAEWLKADPARSVALVGHTDASGGLKANIQLSKKRAEAVRQVLLTRFDVAPGQVVAEGVGPLAPRASNQTEAGRQKNRRVEVLTTSTQ